jgi:hypothetical protein
VEELMQFSVEIETTAPRSLVEHLLLTAVKAIGENLFPEGGGEDVTITLRDETRMLAMLNLTGDTAADLIAQDRAAWPNGHPCRDCGRMFVDHPNDRCQAWY